MTCSQAGASTRNYVAVALAASGPGRVPSLASSYSCRLHTIFHFTANFYVGTVTEVQLLLSRPRKAGADLPLTPLTSQKSAPLSRPRPSHSQLRYPGTELRIHFFAPSPVEDLSPLNLHSFFSSSTFNGALSLAIQSAASHSECSFIGHRHSLRCS